nr:hypothetical protein [Polymorphobacter sp.]
MRIWWQAAAFLGLIAGVMALSVVVRRPTVMAFSPVRVELPDGAMSTSFGGSDSGIVDGNCLACHSADFVRGQPVLTAAEWTAEVAKMRKVYKAPIAEADDAAIVAWLVAMQERRGGG